MSSSIEPAENRRYTDREVGLVLKRAAELEEKRHRDGGGRGLTRRELHDIGREVGLSGDALDDALAELGRGGPSAGVSLFGPPPLSKSVRAVPGSLAKESLQRLIQLVEDNTATTGTVTEALGAVRWTSVPVGSRMNQTTQVAFTPTGSETQIQVTHRFAPKFRAVVSLLPAMWGGMIGGAVAASAGAAALPVLGLVGGSAVAGGLIGRTIWKVLAARAARQTDGLAEDVARLAGGLVQNDGDV